MKHVAIILAGGEGARMSNGSLPKQFLEFNGRPILFHTLHVFDTCPVIDHIVVVIRPQFVSHFKQQLDFWPITKPYSVVEGGAQRQDSVWNALMHLSEHESAYVIIHDAVRPFVTHDIIARSIEGAQETGAADVVVKTSDTIVQGDGEWVDFIPDRSNLYNGQTPQTFRLDVIRAAHQRAIDEQFNDTTDDVKLVLRNGGAVKLVEGSYENIKLTTQFDIYLAQLIYDQRKASYATC